MSCDRHFLEHRDSVGSQFPVISLIPCVLLSYFKHSTLILALFPISRGGKLLVDSKTKEITSFTCLPDILFTDLPYSRSRLCPFIW